MSSIPCKRAFACCPLFLVGCATDPQQSTETSALQKFPGATEPASICAPGSGTFTANVTNAYFPLRVCSRRTLAGFEDGVEVAVRITVLDEIKMIQGVPTRVVEEFHTEDGELVELSYNYFTQAVGGGIPQGATSPRNGSVCYYGEHVDIFNDDGTVTHEGQWLVGQNNAKAGIIMPSRPKVGQAYLQEVAPGIAQDRAWHTALGPTLLAVTEDTPLEPGQFSHKVYRRGSGLVRDGEAGLVSLVQLSEDDCEAETDDED